MKKIHVLVMVAVTLFSSYCLTRSGDRELQAQTFALSGVDIADSTRFITSGDNGRTAYVWELHGTTPVCIGQGTADGTLFGLDTDSESPASPPITHFAYPLAAE